VSEPLDRLREILAGVFDLGYTAELLMWDQETYMPPGGVAARARALARLMREAHERFTSPAVDRLLEELGGQGFDPDSFEGALLRVTRRDYEKAVRIPAELVAEAARASSEARPVWQRARQESDWAAFAPCLARNVDINRRIAEAIGYRERPYDALLDREEPGMTTARLEAIFGELKSAIVPLVRDIAARPDSVDDSCLYGEWDPGAQLAFAEKVSRALGYDFARGRQDVSAHPFSVGMATGDVRITTRVSNEFLPQALFGTIHESGHGMYSQGHPEAFEGTPLWGGASPGMHESQSRLWENLVARSLPFWEHFLPELKAAFPGRLDGVDLDAFYRAVNRVYPSLIRVEADEVTYNLHILLRFELENDLLEGRLRAQDVPAAWNAKMREYLGIEVPSDADGALQDVHWSGVSFGGFPSYTLGNLIGAQLMAAARRELPDLDREFAAGRFQSLHGWLTENVYAQGRKYTPDELLRRTTGEGLSARPWIEYVRRKFGEIYGLD
jgi:carboxypeptidase Taq